MNILLSMLTKDMFFSENDDGTKIYTHPEKNYKNIFFPPLRKKQIKEMELQLSTKVPEYYSYILLISNGLQLFNNKLQIFSYIPLNNKNKNLGTSVVQQNLERTNGVSKELFYFAKDENSHYFYIKDEKIYMMDLNGILLRTWLSFQDWLRDMFIFFEEEKETDEVNKIDRNFIKMHRILENMLGEEITINNRIFSLCTVNEMKQLTFNRYIPIFTDDDFGATILIEYGKETKEVYCLIDNEISEISPKFQTFIQSFKYLKENSDLIERGIDDEDEYQDMVDKLSSINRRKGFFYWVSWLEN